MSRLENLSHIDFEELCIDIARAETGLRFAAFGPGPDSGVDGRHSKGDQSTILQCKHYVRSSFSKLKTAVGREVKKLPNLSPERYILFTSQSLTPARSDKIAAILGEYLKDSGDIWGQEDIEASLRRHPAIEKAHVKLWFSSTAVLERILQSGLVSYTQATKQEILDELRVYVRNNSFDEAYNKLEQQKVLVISGPPGVGKTTLAKMLSYHYLNEGWQFCSIKTLDAGFAQIEDDIPTIFFFDDFLGRIKLDHQSLLQRESALSTFVKRVRASKNARFVLTTRAHIFEEARQISDYVDEKRFQLAKYLLDVGKYTRKIKSYILFNHLSASNLTQEHFEALLKGDWLQKIIDHKNYNPRVIASASSESLDRVEPADYPGYLYNALNNPELVWSKPFRALDMRSQNLLVALFFGDEFGQEIEHLRANYSELHRKVCLQYGQASMPTDFEEALKSLESGFVSISGESVSFVNPSLRDFLKSYLNEREFLLLLPGTSQRADFALKLWSHVKDAFKSHPDFLGRFATAFIEYANRINATRSLLKVKEDGWWSVLQDDLPVSSRVELLLQWWEASDEDCFISLALALLTEGKIELVTLSDGQLLPELHWWISNFLDAEHPLRTELLDAVTDRLIEIIDGVLPANELISIIESVRHSMDEEVPETVEESIDKAAHFEFFETQDAISHLDSEQNLSEHLEHLDALAKLTGYDPVQAKEIVSDRLSEFEEPDYGEYRPSYSSRGSSSGEQFSDQAITSLFSNLIR